MPRAYIRIDPQLFERKVIDQKYPPQTFSAFVGALCLAETQPQRGVFRDRRVLKALLGDRLAREIPALISHGDLIEDSTGRLRIEGWEHWQEGDLTVPERMRRLRDRKRSDGSERNGVTPHDTAPVTTSVTAARQTVSVEAEAIAVSGGGDGGPSRPPRELTIDERRATATETLARAREVADLPETPEVVRRAAAHAVVKAEETLAALDVEEALVEGAAPPPEAGPDQEPALPASGTARPRKSA